MTKNKFKRATQQFDRDEDAGGKLYYRALKLIEAGFTLEGHMLILATWNTAAFRYVLGKFKLEKYEKTLGQISDDLKALQKCDLMETDLKPYKLLIVRWLEIEDW
jgi:hypothetical protein